ncbi:uncharacterized protein B0P05DRAFT_584096 [Gilbertella persicaria]|uniref:uncharacterized protein n=1 Tax=Gilbertella persicaria TaxID=101096 RepID=UPI002220C931|nr:uncharacterized protein B0P05DRAFT_584096 [Gilbertella persicaria]KAI8090973.1 hypothetical protein B0P05DRAFT_584096 [Gilbertella persicaria]
MTANQKDNTRIHSSIKRPRAPIACYRCHHKKVRCDGIHPNCTRCLSTGVLCAYPSSRRSRNTQPTNIDPFIDNLSQLEVRIRRIENDLEAIRSLAQQNDPDQLNTRMSKTEKDLQESRSIVAQLRLKGEQRVARGKRAANTARETKGVGPKPKSKLKKDPSPPPPPPPLPSAVQYPFFSSNEFMHSYFPTFPNTFMTEEGWPLLNTSANQQELNALVDPMIIAAAVEAQQQPMLSNYLQDSRTKSLESPHLLVLQPSSSSTSTASTHTSFGYSQPFCTPFMDNMI